jgi:hypothetical protein
MSRFLIMIFRQIRYPRSFSSPMYIGDSEAFASLFLKIHDSTIGKKIRSDTISAVKLVYEDRKHIASDCIII